MALRGERVSLRPLTRADLDEIEAWTPFSEPPDLALNRLPWHRLGKDLWHELQSIDTQVERYAVLDLQDRVIGVIGLAGVDGDRSPTLSVFLGADYVGQGLGPDALRTVLDHAFRQQGCRAVRLDVAAWNSRARRAYEKCGFRLAGQGYRPVDEDQVLTYLDEPRYGHLRRFYRVENGRTYALFYRMRLDVEDWVAQQPGYSPPGADRPRAG